MQDPGEFEISEDKALISYRGNSRDVVIPEGIISIDEWAFWQSKDIVETVQLPSSISRIGNDAFAECEKLKSITISYGIEKIGKRAFEGCSKLENINLPSTLIEIGEDAFNGCTNLHQIYWPAYVIKLPAGTFSNSGLQKIVLSKNVKVIGENAFRDCRNLQKITGCNLNSLDIGDNAFSNCEQLADENGLLIIQNRLFYVDSKKKKIIIPDNVAKIESDAFSYGNMKEIEAPLNGPVRTQHLPIEHDGFTLSFRNREGRIVAKVIIAQKDENWNITDKFNRAIQINDQGEFDFFGYDAMFPVLNHPENKMRMALVRLMYPYALSDEFREIYSQYLRRESFEAGRYAIDNNDRTALEFLCSENYFTEKVIQKLIDISSQSKSVEVTAMLMEYKNKHYKKTATIPSLGNLKNDNSSSSGLSGRPVSEWKKIYDFKYKRGGVIITGYHGSDSTVSFPERIGEHPVIGIGNRGEFRAFAIGENVKKIIIPGWIQIIELYTFGWINHDLEVEIQEGVTGLNAESFAPGIFKGILTVKIPESMNSFEGDFSALESYGDNHAVRWLIINNSPADKYFSEHGYEFTYTSPYTSRKDVLKPVNSKINMTSGVSKKDWKIQKKGIHLLSRYLGHDENVFYPESLDGIKINGIANTAGETPENYKHISSVMIPEGYEYLGNKAFAGCENLMYITLPTTIREIGSQVFEGCKNIEELYIPKGVSFTGHNTFNQSEIKTLILDISDGFVPAKLFEGAKIHNFVILGGTLKIKGTGKIFDILPDSIYTNEAVDKSLLTNIGWNAEKIHYLSEFDESIINNISLRQIITEAKKVPAAPHPATVEEDHVDSIDFPKSSFSFTGFTGLYTGEINEISLVKNRILSAGGSIDDDYSNISDNVSYLIVPDYKLLENPKIKKAEKLRQKGNSIAIIRLSECLRCADKYFENQFGKTEYEKISEYEFELKDGKIILTKYFGKEAEIIVPGLVSCYPVSFTESTFDVNRIIKNVLIDGLKEIPNGAFSYCEELTSVSLKEGLLTIGEGAFLGCKSLESISLPNTLRTIKNHAFTLSGIKSVAIPEGMVELDANAFSACKALKEITIPDSLKSIDHQLELEDHSKRQGTVIQRIMGSNNSIAKTVAGSLKCKYVEI